MMGEGKRTKSNTSMVVLGYEENLFLALHSPRISPSFSSFSPSILFPCTVLVKRRASSKIVLRDTRFLSWMPRFENGGRDEREHTWESIALIRRGYDIYIWDIEVNLKIFWRGLVSKEISLNISCSFFLSKKSIWILKFKFRRIKLEFLVFIISTSASRTKKFFTMYIIEKLIVTFKNCFMSRIMLWEIIRKLDSYFNYSVSTAANAIFIVQRDSHQFYSFFVFFCFEVLTHCLLSVHA